HIAYTEARYTDEDIDEPDRRRLRLLCETQTYELTGIDPEDAGDLLTPDPRDNRNFSIDELRAYRLSERYQTAATPVGPLQYHQQPPPPAPPGQPNAHKRLVELARTLYFDDASDTAAPTRALDFGKHGPRGLKYEDYKLALTDDLLNRVFQTRDAAGAVVE